MAKRGEGRGAEGGKKPPATEKKVGRKELAQQEATRRAAHGAETTKAPGGEAAAVPPAKETPAPVATPAAETAGAGDVAVPTPTAPTTAEAEREQAIQALVDQAITAYKTAKEAGQGFVLGGIFSKEVATLKKEYGPEAYEKVKRRFAERNDGPAADTAPHPGSGELRKGEFRGFKLDPEKHTLQAEWSEIGLEEASPAWAKIAQTATERFGADWFGDAANRDAFTEALVGLRSRIESSISKMKITSEPGSKEPLTAETVFEGRTFSTSTSGSETARIRKARSDLRSQIIKKTLQSFLSKFQTTHGIESEFLPEKTTEVNIIPVTEGGKTRYVLSMTMPDGRVAQAEWGIHQIVPADKLTAGLTESEIQALAEDKFREAIYEGTIRAVKIDAAPLPANSGSKKREGSQAKGSKKDQGASSRSAEGESEAEDDESHRKGRPEGGKKGGATIRKGETIEGSIHGGAPRREPLRPRETITPEQRLAMMKNRVEELNQQIKTIDAEKAGVQKGSDKMAEIAARQTPLMLERQELKRLIAVLELQTKGEGQSAPVAGGAAEAAPAPEPTPAPTDAKQLDDDKRTELITQLTKAEQDLAVRRKKLSDLNERAKAEERKKQPQKKTNHQIEYEQHQIRTLDGKIAGIRRELEEAGRVTEEEKEAEARRGLPLFIRQGIRIIAESVATARVLAEQLQSYGEEKVGAARAEAIDNAIEIINAAEKERAQIVASLEQKTDVATLHTLVGRSSNMAIQSTEAMLRLQGFVKELEQGVPSAAAESEATPQERAALEAQLREINGKIASLTEQQNTMRTAVDGNKSTLRNIGRDEGRRRQFLEEAAQLEDDLQKATDNLQGLKVLREQLTHRLAALEANPAEGGKPIDDAAHQEGAAEGEAVDPRLIEMGDRILDEWNKFDIANDSVGARFEVIDGLIAQYPSFQGRYDELQKIRQENYRQYRALIEKNASILQDTEKDTETKLAQLRTIDSKSRDLATQQQDLDKAALALLAQLETTEPEVPLRPAGKDTVPGGTFDDSEALRDQETIGYWSSSIIDSTRKHNKLFTEIRTDISFLRAFPDLHPDASDSLEKRQLDDFEQQETNIETEVNNTLQKQDDIRVASELSSKDKISKLESIYDTISTLLAQRDLLFSRVRRMAQVRKDTTPFLKDNAGIWRSDIGFGAAQGPARGPSAEQLRAAHGGVPQVGGRSSGEPAGPLLGGREVLQIGAGAAAELSPEETQEILAELSSLHTELERLDEDDRLLMQLLEQLDSEEK